MTDGIERRFKIVIPVLAVLVVAAFAVSAYAFAHAKDLGCQRADVTLTVLNDLLAEGRRQVLVNTRMDLEQRRAAVKFYDTYLARIESVRC